AYIQRPPLFFAGERPIPPYWFDKFRLRVPVDVAQIMRAAEVHRRGVTGKGVTVAMADTGFYRHPYFVEQSYNFLSVAAPDAVDPYSDGHGHGTGECANLFATAPGINFIGVKMGASTTLGFKTAVDLEPDVMTNSWGYHADFPGTNMPNWLKRGRIDAGFYLCSPDELVQLGSEAEEPLHAIKLADFAYRVIGPVGWQNRVEAADWASLARLPWIGTPETSVHHRLLASVFNQLECRPNVVALVDQEPSMLEMVRSGIGLSLCRESIALHQKQTFGLSVCDAVSVPACLCFVTLARRKDSPMLSETFSLLDRVW
ncbi:hypothetical protein LCGC14_3045830, partial [marine sediment metagenome]